MLVKYTIQQSWEKYGSIMAIWGMEVVWQSEELFSYGKAPNMLQSRYPKNILQNKKNSDSKALQQNSIFFMFFLCCWLQKHSDMYWNHFKNEMTASLIYKSIIYTNEYLRITQVFYLLDAVQLLYM